MTRQQLLESGDYVRWPALASLLVVIVSTLAGATIGSYQYVYGKSERVEEKSREEIKCVRQELKEDVTKIAEQVKELRLESSKNSVMLARIAERMGVTNGNGK